MPIGRKRGVEPKCLLGATGEGILRGPRDVMREREMSSYMRAGLSRQALAKYHTPDPRWKPMATQGPYERLRRARKVKRLGYTPTSRWDGMTRPQKRLVQGAVGLAGLGALGGLLGGLLGNKKKAQKGGRGKKKKTCHCRRRKH